MNASFELQQNTSSLQFKDNVVDYTEATDLLKTLRPREFDWNELSASYGMHDVGLIAEEVAQIYNGLFATYDADGNPWSVRYDLLAVPLIVGWQDHESRIKAIEQQLANELSVTQTTDGQLTNIDSEQLRTSLVSLGLAVNTNGTLQVDTLVATTKIVTAKVEAQRIQMTDQRNGDVYCTWIDYGQLTTVRGECDTIEIVDNAFYGTETIATTTTESSDSVTFTADASTSTTITDETATSSSSTSPTEDGVTSTTSPSEDGITSTTSPSEDGTVALTP